MHAKAPFAGFGRLLAIGATLVFVLALTLYGAVHALSYTRSDAAARGWADRLGTLEEVLARYPPRDCNAAAIELERVVARLGIDLAPRALREVTIDETDADALRDVSGDLQRYVYDELAHPGSRPRPPQRTVVAWLDAHAAPLDAVVRQLNDGPPPRWLLQLDRLHAAPVPNLLAHVQLQKILAADALYRVQQDDAAAALARVEAAWRLNESLAGDPVLITRLITFVGLRLQAGVLRHIDPVPPVWRERIGAARAREALSEALELEAWLWNHVDENIVTAAAAPRNQPYHAVYRLVAPYVRLCAADVSDRLRVAIERLRDLDYLCDRDLSLYGADLAIDVPFWNRLGGLMVPQLRSTVERVARLEVDLELTARVLDLRGEQAAGGAWTAATARFEPSRACPGDRWDYRFDAANGLTIALSRELRWPASPGPLLPTRFHLEP